MLMNRIPPAVFPRIAAVNLARIPVLDPDLFDLSVLSQQVNDIRKGTLEIDILQSCKKDISEIKKQLSSLNTLKDKVDEMNQLLSQDSCDSSSKSKHLDKLQ